MARRRQDPSTNGQATAAWGGAGILAEVPTIPHLEARLADLLAEAARVERILNCLRGMGEGEPSTSGTLVYGVQGVLS